MSVACLLLAEGAVRLPSGRFMPKEDQSSVESCWSVNSLESNALAVERFPNASNKGMPPVFCGGGSLMSCEKTWLAKQEIRRRQGYGLLRMRQFIVRTD